MSHFKKNILLSILLSLLSCTITTFGYNVRFSNVTERTLVICYKLEGLSKEYYQILYPDQSVSHYFPNLHCFGASILWAEVKERDRFNKELPFRGGLDLFDPETSMVDLTTMQELFRQYLANKYAFIPMQIKVVDNETFQMTVDAAEQLMQGIDDLTCQTIKTVAQFMNPLASPSKSTSSAAPTNIGEPESSAGSLFGLFDAPIEETVKTKALNTVLKDCRFGLGKIAKGGADLAGVSLCRDLHIVIVDTGEIGNPVPTKPGAVVSRVKKPVLIAEINQGG